MSDLTPTVDTDSPEAEEELFDTPEEVETTKSTEEEPDAEGDGVRENEDGEEVEDLDADANDEDDIIAVLQKLEAPRPEGEVTFLCERYPNLRLYGNHGRIGEFRDGVFRTADRRVIAFLDDLAAKHSDGITRRIPKVLPNGEIGEITSRDQFAEIRADSSRNDYGIVRA